MNVNKLSEIYGEKIGPFVNSKVEVRITPIIFIVIESDDCCLCRGVPWNYYLLNRS